MGWFSLEKGRLWGHVIAAFQYLNGACKKGGDKLFTEACKCFTLKEGRIRLDIWNKFYTRRVVRHWNRLPREAVGALSLAVFKARLGGALSNLV